MSDQIFIRGLTVHAHHGVLDYEGKVGQRFVIDLELDAELGRAAKSDRLADTISYARVAEVAERAFTSHAFKLLEASAGAIADAILADFPTVTQVRVVVHKPHAPIAAMFDDVGVALTRRREG